MTLVNVSVKERLLSIPPLAMSKTKATSKNVFAVLPLRKVRYHSWNLPLSSWQFFEGAIFSFHGNARRTRDSTIPSSTTTTIGGDEGRNHARKMDVCRTAGENQLCCRQNHTGWQGKTQICSIYQKYWLTKLGWSRNRTPWIRKCHYSWGLGGAQASSVFLGNHILCYSDNEFSIFIIGSHLL